MHNCQGYTRSSDPVRPVEEKADGRVSLNINIDLPSVPDEKKVWEGVALIMEGCMGLEKAVGVINQMQERLDATSKDGRTLVVSLSQTEEKHDGTI